MSLDNLRADIGRHVEDDGRVRETGIDRHFPLVGSIGEVISLNPAVVELLNGEEVMPTVYTGPVPSVGQKIMMVCLAHYWVAITGVKVI